MSTMPKPTREAGDIPEWKRPIRRALETARDNAARSVQFIRQLLEQEESHLSEIDQQISALMGDSGYLQPTQVSREFIGKSLDESILLVLDREGKALSLESL